MLTSSSSWLDDASVVTAEDRQREAERRQVEAFKRQRAQAIQAATVTTAAGKLFDADEQSIGRMGFRLQKAELTDETIVGWVLADSPAGVKTDVTVGELREAFQLAVENMDTAWGVEGS